MSDLTDAERRMLVAAKEAGMNYAHKYGERVRWDFIASAIWVGAGWTPIDDLLDPPMRFDADSERLMRAAREDDYALICRYAVSNGPEWTVRAVGPKELLGYWHLIRAPQDRNDTYQIIPIPARYRSARDE